jgi:hypothetical protein
MFLNSVFDKCLGSAVRSGRFVPRGRYHYLSLSMRKMDSKTCLSAVKEIENRDLAGDRKRFQPSPYTDDR